MINTSMCVNVENMGFLILKIDLIQSCTLQVVIFFTNLYKNMCVNA